MADKRMTAGRKVALAALVFTLCFIWGNSLVPAAASARISNFIKDILNMAAESATGNSETIAGDGVIRKLAHALEFAALGAEITYLAKTGSDAVRFDRLAFWGFGAAFTDETLQLIQPGRSAEIRDVWIDFGGYAFGCIICIIIWVLIERRKKKGRDHHRREAN